jgi:hypothetical protein
VFCVRAIAGIVRCRFYSLPLTYGQEVWNNGIEENSDNVSEEFVLFHYKFYEGYWYI